VRTRGGGRGGAGVRGDGRADAGAIVERIVPARGAGRAAVIAGGRRVARALPEAIAEAGIRVGVAWGGELEARLAALDEFHGVRRRALRLLGARARSRAALQALLVRGTGRAGTGCSADVARRVVDGLAAAGLVDDAGLARSAVRAARARGPASRGVLDNRLESLAIDAGVRSAVLDELGVGEMGAEEARQAARERLRRLPRGTAPAAAARRVHAWLVRRGCDPDVAGEAVAGVLRRAGDG